MHLPCTGSPRFAERVKPLAPPSSLIASLSAAIFLSAGCATPVTPVDASVVMQKFGMLRNGETTKQEILDRMGHPASTFEQDHALTYRVFENGVGKIDVGVTRPPSRAEYSLVLIFDDRNVLNRHSLVFKK